MLNRWSNEYVISYESTRLNFQLFEVMEDYDLDEGVVKKTFHLVLIFSLLDNICHLVNASEELIRYVGHLDPCAVHE